MLDAQIGPAFLAVLGLAFGGHGVRELALAYRLDSFGEWVEKAVLGAGGLTAGALFAACACRLLGGAQGSGGGAVGRPTRREGARR